MNDKTLAAAPFKLDGAAIAWVRATLAACRRATSSPSSSTSARGQRSGRARAQQGIPARRHHARALRGTTAADEIAIIDGLQRRGAGAAARLGRPRRQPDEPAVRHRGAQPAGARGGRRCRGDHRRSAGSWPTRRTRSASTGRFTPVLDINAAFRSAIVATRGYGSDVDDDRAPRAGADRGVPEGRRRRDGQALAGRRVMTTATSTSSPPSIRCRWRSGRRPSAGSIAPRSRPACCASWRRTSRCPRSSARSIPRPASRPSGRPRSARCSTRRCCAKSSASTASSSRTRPAWPGSAPGRRAASTIPEIIAGGCDVILFSTIPERDFGCARGGARRRPADAGAGRRGGDRACSRSRPRSGFTGPTGAARGRSPRSTSPPTRASPTGDAARADAGQGHPEPAAARSREAPARAGDLARHRLSRSCPQPLPFALPEMLRGKGLRGDDARRRDRRQPRRASISSSISSAKRRC